jgi:hypothetical protein
MKRFLIYLMLFGCLYLGGCRPSILEPLKYVSWVENEKNGLKAKKEIGDFVYTLQYKPLPYIALMEKRDPQVKTEYVQKRVKELRGMQYYTLTITSKDKKEVLASHIDSENEYYDRLQYLVDGAQDDISLIEAGDTLPCRLYHFERDYGITPNAKILLGFEEATGEKAKEDRTIYFNERILGSGRMFLAINASSISKLPQLKSY